MFEKLRHLLSAHKTLEPDDCLGCVIARQEVDAGARASVCQKCLCVWLGKDAFAELGTGTTMPPNNQVERQP